MGSRPAVSWLLRCYPAAWRARYGDEFAALLEDYRPGPLGVIDIMLGSLDAWLHPEAIGGGVLMLPKLRTSALAVFCAWVVYVLAGLAFYGVLDDNPLTALAGSQPALRIAVLLVQVGAVLALFAVLAGALPIAWIMLRQAWAGRRWSVLFLLSVPLLAMLAIGIAFVAVFIAASRTPGPFMPFGIGGLWLVHVVFIAGALASMFALVLAALRSEIGEQQYRTARTAAKLVVLAMGLTTAGLLAWGIAAYALDPANFRSTPGYMWLNTDASWLLLSVIMLVAAVAAFLALRRSGDESQQVTA